MTRDEVSAATHAGMAFANPLSADAIDGALDRLRLPPAARVLDVGCGAGGLLERIAARHDVVTTGVEPSSPMAALARRSAHVVHEAPMTEAALAPGAFALVACIASSHAFGTWEDALVGLAALVAPGGIALVGEGFWRRPPSAGYLAALGGAEAGELPDHAGLLDGARRAGWEVTHEQVASDADWAAYEEGLIANGRRALEADADPDLRAWVDAAQTRWDHPDGRDTLGFCLLELRRA